MSDSEHRGSEGAGNPRSQADSAPPGGGRHQRKLRNYLLDKRFQLKYTGIVIGITAVVSAVLGLFLYSEIVVSQQTILARDLSTDTFTIGPGDFEQRQKVSNSIDREFNEALQSKLQVVVKINNAPAGATADLYEENFEVEVAQKTATLVASLLVFLLVLAVVWVYLTHKIAGPVFKLKLLFSRVQPDKLRVAGRLRKGDELQEAFISFQDMIGRLREHRSTNVKRIGELADTLEKDADSRESVVESLRKLRDELAESLED